MNMMYFFINENIYYLSRERENSYDWILRGEFKKQHLCTVPKFCPYIISQYLPNVLKLYTECFIVFDELVT